MARKWVEVGIFVIHKIFLTLKTRFSSPNAFSPTCNYFFRVLY